MKSRKLYFYTMTHDTGFAPNPFGGFLTLANCKPVIRKKAKKGDIIVGISGIGLDKKYRNSINIVWIGIVSDKVTFCEYWNNPKYQGKKPKIPGNNNFSLAERSGDNVYKPLIQNAVNAVDFSEIDHLHKPHGKETDIGGKFVLVCDEFWYFGKSPIQIEGAVLQNFNFFLNIKIAPRVHRVEKNQTIINDFLNYIKGHFVTGVRDLPYNWNDKKIKGCSSTGACN